MSLYRDTTCFCISYKCGSGNHYSPTLIKLRLRPFHYRFRPISLLELTEILNFNSNVSVTVKIGKSEKRNGILTTKRIILTLLYHLCAISLQNFTLIRPMSFPDTPGCENVLLKITD